MRLKNILLFIFVTALLFWTGSPLSQSAFAASSESKIKIAYLPIVQALPLFVAIDKGYFKQAGIEVEAIKFEAPNQIIDALLAGNIDAAAAAATGITAITQFRNPGTLKIFALNGSSFPNHLEHALMVKKDSTINNIKQLKGEKIGILPGIQWRTIATHIFLREGLQPGRDIELVELAIPLQLEALSTGQVDALLALDPVVTIGRAQGLAKVLMDGPATRFVANPFYGGCGVLQTQFAASRPKAAAALLAAFKKAIVYIHQNPEAARKCLKGYTPLNDETISKVTMPVFKFYSEFKPSDVKAMQRFVDIFTEHGVIEGKVDVRRFIFR